MPAVRRTPQALPHRVVRDLMPALTGDMTTLSVSDVENYLRCPYGWAVGRLLRQALSRSERAQRGTAAHDVLAKLHGAPATPDAVDAALRRVNWDDDPALAAQITHTCQRYASHHWQAAQVECEVPVSLEWEGVQLRGRVDRVDTTPWGLLVVDYKLSHHPGSEDASELQPYLYPYMLAHVRQLPVAGFMYVSLRHNQHRAYLQEDVPLPASGVVRYDWEERATQALERARVAIQGIRAGAITHVGRNCRAPWCAHHLVSPTLASYAQHAPEEWQ